MHLMRHVPLSNFKVISNFSPPRAAAASHVNYAAYAVLGHSSDQLGMVRFPGSMELEAANQKLAHIRRAN
jgi:hypothetical protein